MEENWVMAHLRQLIFEGGQPKIYVGTEAMKNACKNCFIGCECRDEKMYSDQCLSINVSFHLFQQLFSLSPKRFTWCFTVCLANENLHSMLSFKGEIRGLIFDMCDL
jgi:hypothetical protein